MNIIYILGTGRTGTTLLGIALSNNSDIFDTGEILKFCKLRGEPHGFDSSTPNYIFWKGIFNKLKDRVDINHSLDETIHKIEYHKYFFKNFFLRKRSVRYKNYINKFIDALDEEIGENYIVDSSKYPGRALSLKNHVNSRHNINYVYIKRNPISVVNSFSKKNVEQPSKGFLASNAYYFLVNLCCLCFLCTIKRDEKITIRYEDFISRPEEVLNKIQSKFKINLSSSVELIKENKELKTGFIFEGNRIRLKSGVILKKSDQQISPNGIKDYLTLLINGFWYYIK
ncbi:sulfotransferase [Zunongwangia endophytica]|uniref:Sulfotransferase n=1 Tax=Zunongwangia endophytica TaxID=1808945 RepID=A0ABV8HB36_9FLAO|nr:sulfotransferase [Zunongwangia endophytica]MDN3596248.1 sulfotransferase [Zunongwangia endophytica]